MAGVGASKVRLRIMAMPRDDQDNQMARACYCDVDALASTCEVAQMKLGRATRLGIGLRGWSLVVDSEDLLVVPAEICCSLLFIFLYMSVSNCA